MPATESITDDPVRQLPTPAAVNAHIGRLLRELRLARQLYRLSQAAEQHRQQVATRREVAHAAS